MNTSIIIKSTEKLKSNKREEMWSVYHSFYHYSKDSFMIRFEKNTHYALYFSKNRLIGFTGLRIENPIINNKKRLLIYFGQTVVQPNFRGQSLFRRTGLRLLRKYFLSAVDSKIYFWADTLSYKAYLSFSKSVKTCYPSRNQPLTPEIQAVRNYLGDKYYGPKYCRKNGTIQKDRVLVNDHLVRVRPKALIDPDVKFFIQINPKHEIGNGLLTMAEFKPGDIVFALLRMVQKQHLRKIAQLRSMIKSYFRPLNLYN